MKKELLSKVLGRRVKKVIIDTNYIRNYINSSVSDGNIYYYANDSWKILNIDTIVRLSKEYINRVGYSITIELISGSHMVGRISKNSKIIFSSNSKSETAEYEFLQEAVSFIGNEI